VGVDEGGDAWGDDGGGVSEVEVGVAVAVDEHVVEGEAPHPGEGDAVEEDEDSGEAVGGGSGVVVLKEGSEKVDTFGVLKGGARVWAAVGGSCVASMARSPARCRSKIGRRSAGRGFCC
jgi:hypothetical protein